MRKNEIPRMIKVNPKSHVCKLNLIGPNSTPPIDSISIKAEPNDNKNMPGRIKNVSAQ